MNKPFKVASVSKNANSFGLQGMILMAQDGEAYEVGANSLNVKTKGTVLQVPVIQGVATFAGMGFEIPRKLPTAPAPVVKEVWN